MDSIKLYAIKAEQPIGTFYISTITISQLKDIYCINRNYENGGPQRHLDISKVNAISSFCNDPDATFPTPIIVSIKKENLMVGKEIQKNIFELSIERSPSSVSIIDGQHRVEGIIRGGILHEMDIPIVIMSGLDDEDEAYVFATINSNQKPVSPTLIYQLYDVYKSRSPKKTCHEVAKSLNSDDSSPFYRRLKITDVKKTKMESLTQGSFSYYLLDLICNRSQADIIAVKIKNNEEYTLHKPFGVWFHDAKDEYITKTMKNYFNAIRKVFPDEWNNPENILCKSTGYGGFMKALDCILPEAIKRFDLSETFFVKGLLTLKQRMIKNEKCFSSSFYASSAAGQSTLRDDVLIAFNETYGQYFILHNQSDY